MRNDFTDLKCGDYREAHEEVNNVKVVRETPKATQPFKGLRESYTPVRQCNPTPFVAMRSGWTR
jgi:hypothetical protein